MATTQNLSRIIATTTRINGNIPVETALQNARENLINSYLFLINKKNKKNLRYDVSYMVRDEFREFPKIFDFSLQYIDLYVPWADIIEAEDNQIARFKEVIERIYAKFFDKEDYKCFHSGLNRLARDIICRQVDTENPVSDSLSPAKLRSNAHIVYLRVTRMFPLEKYILLLLSCTCNSYMTDVIIEQVHKLVETVNQLRWTEMSMFRYFIVPTLRLIYPSRKKIDSLRLEGMLDTFTSVTNIPSETSALITSLKDSSNAFADTNKSFKEGIENLVKYLTEFVEKMTKKFSFDFSPTTLYSMTGAGEELTFVQKALDLFERLYAIVVNFSFKDCVYATASYLFSMFSDGYNKLLAHLYSAPMPIKICLLSIATYFMVEANKCESTTLSSIFWKLVVLYVSGLIFVGTLDSLNIVKYVIKTLFWFQSNPGISFSFTAALIFFLKEVYGMSIKECSMDMLKFLTHVPKYSSGIVASVTIIGTLWNKVVYSLVDKNPDLQACVLYDKADKVYMETNDLVEDLKEALAEGTIVHSENLSRVKSSFTKLTNVMKTRMPRELSPYMSTIQHTLSKGRAYIENAKKFGVDVTGPRQEPVCILIRGEPGVLKSHFSSLVNYVVQRVLKERDYITYEEMIKDTFAINVHSDYWEGYTSQPVVVMDDWMQMREQVGDATSSSKIIDMVNTMPTPLNMANVDAKGTAYFVSKAVILTSNLRQIASEAIISNEALARRIHLYLDIEIKPKYQAVNPLGMKTGKINPDTFMKGPNGESIVPTDVWNITHYRSCSKEGQPQNGHRISWPDLIELIEKEYHFRNKIYRSMQMNLDRFRTAMFSSSVRDSFVDLDKRFLKQKYIGVGPPAESLVSVADISNFESVNAINIVLDSYEKHHDSGDFFAHVQSRGYDSEMIKNCLMISLRLWVVKFREYEQDGKSTVGLTEALHRFGLALTDDKFLGTINMGALCENNEAGNLPVPSHMNIGILYNVVNDVKFQSEHALDMYKKKYCPPIVEYVRRHKGDILRYTTAACVVFATLICISRWFMTEEHYAYLNKIVSFFYKSEDIRYDEDTEELVCDSEIIAPLQLESTVKGKTKVVKPKSKKPAIKIVGVSEMQGLMPLNYAGRMQMEIVNKVDANSSVVILASRAYGPLHILGNALFLCDDIIMFSKHYLVMLTILTKESTSQFSGYDDLYITFCEQSDIRDYDGDGDQVLFQSRIIGKRGYDLDAFISSGEHWGQVTGAMDLVLLPVGQGNCRRDITKFFLTESEYQELEPLFPGIISAKKGAKDIVTNITCRKCTNVTVPNFDKKGFITLAKAVDYQFSMGPGSCGSPVFVTREKSSCILGVHAAGSTDDALIVTGKAVVISREQINAFVGTFRMKPEGDVPSFPFPSRVHNLAKPPMNNVSSIVATSIQGLLGPVTKAPARLRNFVNSEGMRIDPLLLAYSGYGKGEYNPVDSAIQAAKEEMVADLKYNLPTFSTNVVSTEDAIHSIELDGYTVPGIARGTSVGYPYNTNLCKSKKSLWGADGDYVFNTEEWLKLKEIVIRKEENLRRGNREEFYFQDCLKDETIGLNKVEIGKTRMFSACPVDYLILFRKYYLGLISMLTNSRFRFQSMVGINPLSSEWEKLANYLAEPSSISAENFLDGDFAGFDKSQKKEIFIIIYEIIEELYKMNLPEGEESHNDMNVRKLLWIEVYNSIHVYDKYIIEWEGALPSGHPMTTLINSFYNIFSFYYCWHRTCSSIFVDQIERPLFVRNVGLGVYGDDVIFGVSHIARNFFTFDVIKGYMSELGLDFTPAEKHLTTDNYKSLDKCTFLKRGFRREPLLSGVFVAPLSLDSLINSLYWRKKTTLEVVHLRTVGETFLDELAFHDYKVYAKLSLQFIDIVKKLEIVSHRIELDQAMRQKHVLYSYDNVYEFTDKYIERHLQLRQGARLYDDADSFALEGNLWDNPEVTLVTVRNLCHNLLDFQEETYLRVGHILNLLDEEFPPYENTCISQLRWDFHLNLLVEITKAVAHIYVNTPGVDVDLIINSSEDLDKIWIYVADSREKYVVEVPTNLNTTMETTIKLLAFNSEVSVVPRFEIAQVMNGIYSKRKEDTKLRLEGDVVDITVTDVTSVTSDVPANMTQGPTASFVSADSTKLTAYVKEEITEDFKASQITGANQSLVDFFAKPILHTLGSFAITDSATTTFPIIYLPYDAQTVAMWRDKFKGFMSMKFDMVVRLQVNSTRFQQGRYILYYVPYCGDTINAATVGTPVAVSETWNMMHSANTHCITQLPHVELDIATQSEVVLRVPYINADPFTPMTLTPAGEGSWGRVSIFPYAALQATAGSTDASYSLWYSLENVELYTPTLPQGDIEKRERKQDGPITQGLTLATRATKIIGRIPILSAIAGPTSFFLDVASDVARVFGWSRPLDVAKVERRFLSAAPFVCNMDAPIFGMPLTNFVDTSVGNLPGFAGSGLDEMAFANIVSRYSYYARYVWATTDLSSTNLIHLPITPANFYRDKVMAAPALTYRQHTPTSLVASLFRFWRGSMKFKFKLVKTEFHSGRILVTYVPFDYRLPGPITTALNADMQQYASKTTYDVSSMTEFEIILPFASNAPWADTSTAIGNLDVFVLDPLKAPNTVTSSITILVEVAMCPDAQFNDYHSENVRTPYVPEIRVEGASVAEQVVDSQCIGGSGSVDLSDAASQYCMGDEILSFRTLLKRPAYILMTDSVRTALPGTYTQTAGFQTFCAPYRAAAAFSTIVLAVDTLAFPSTGANDLYGLLTSMFALSRGSLVCQLHNNVSVTPNTGIIVRKLKTPIVGPGVTNPLQRAAGSVGNTGGVSYEGTNGMRGGAAPLITYNMPNQLLTQVKVDCYNRAYSRPNASLICCDNLNLTIPPDEWSQGSYAPAVVIAASTAQNSLYSWSRFAADDFSMGYFICVPPVLNYLSDIATDGSY